jgi:hypothetical protein
MIVNNRMCGQNGQLSKHKQVVLSFTERPERGVNHPPSSSDEVKARIELRF